MPAHARRAAVDLRLMRAAVFAAVCVALSAIAHGCASAQNLPVWALAAGWLGIFAVAAQLAGRERSLPGIAGLLLCGQLALHALFSLGQWHTATAHEGHRHPAPMDGMPAGHMAGAGPSPGEALYHAMGSAVPMLLGHIAAAAAAGWLLRRGDAALWRVVRLSARAAQAHVFPLRTALALVRALLTGLHGAPVPRSAPARVPKEPRAGSVLLQHCVVRRGPPAYALAA
jgi:hypothetical protein